MSRSTPNDGSDPRRENHVEQLASECLRRIDAGEVDALDRVCDEHPELAIPLRRMFDNLEEFGLVGEAMPPTEPTSLPDEIGGYHVLEVIGQGGMGTVLKAEQRAPFRRLVAIKVIKLGMDSKQVLARFELERRALAAMSHNCIARVFDAGTTDRGQPYFVMELIEGLPITEFCDKHRLSLRERIVLFQQVCAGVQHAHQKGVIHRDLKPGNILVVREGDRAIPKILDFGLAKAMNRDLLAQTIYTEREQIVGTPEYMAPEQAACDQETIDTRVDIYSLGVILYELLAGELPFSGVELRRQGWDEIRRVLTESEPKKPSTKITSGERGSTHAQRRSTTVHGLAKDLRGDLDWIVLRAIAKEPERRYSSAPELAADLQRHLDHQPVLAGPPSLRYRAEKFLRRNWRGVSAAAAVFVSLAIGLVIAIFQFRDAEAARKDVVEANDKETAARQEVQRKNDALVAATRTLRFRALLAASAQALARKRPYLATRFAREAVRIEPTPDAMTQLHSAVATLHQVRVLSGHTGNLVFAAVGENRRWVTATPYEVRIWAESGDQLAVRGHPSRALLNDFALSGDKLRLATAGDDGRVIVWDLTGAQVAVLSHGSPVQTVEFSPTSNLLLASGKDGTTKIWPDPTAASARVLARGGVVRCAAFSSDGSRVATGFDDGNVTVWETDTWTQLTSFEGASGAVDVKWIHDGSDRNRLVVLGNDQRATVYERGSEPRTLSNAANARCVAVSPDGQLIVVGRDDNMIELWTPDGEFLRLLDDHRGMINQIEFAPSGKLFASCANDYTIRLWGPSGSAIGVLMGHTFKVRAIAFSEDGDRLLSGGDHLSARVWTPRSTAGLPILVGHRHYVTNLVERPDGGQIATASLDSTVRVWDKTGHQLRVLRHPAWVDGIAYAPWAPTEIVTGCYDGRVRIWRPDQDEPEVLPDESEFPSSIIEAGCSSQERRIATFSYNQKRQECYLFSWAYTDGKWKFREHVWARRYLLNDVAFSSDLSKVALACDDGVFVAELDGGSTKKFADSIWHDADFSRDGKRIVAAAKDGSCRVFEVATGRELARLEGPTTTIRNCEFSPDGQLIAIASDTDAHLWRSDGVWVASLSAHQMNVRRAVFSADGSRVYTTSFDRTARSWCTTTAELLELANRVGEFSPLERKQYADVLTDVR